MGAESSEMQSLSRKKRKVFLQSLGKSLAEIPGASSLDSRRNVLRSLRMGRVVITVVVEWSSFLALLRDSRFAFLSDPVNRFRVSSRLVSRFKNAGSPLGAFPPRSVARQFSRPSCNHVFPQQKHVGEAAGRADIKNDFEIARVGNVTAAN